MGVGSLLPTPPELFFLPPRRPKREFIAKTSTHLFKRPELVIRHPPILSRRPDYALVLVLDSNGDESLFLQRPDVSSNLSVADAEEVGEVFVGGEATTFVVEAVDFDEEDFLHQRELIRKPNLFGNPDAFEIAGWSFHVHHSSTRAALLPSDAVPTSSFGMIPRANGVW